MKTLFTLVLILICSELLSQNFISGIVKDQDKNPITGANIFIQGSYDAAISGIDGSFKLKTKLSGDRVLKARLLGYNEYEAKISIKPGNNVQEIILEEKLNELNTVVVQAGTFGASDSKKAVKLNSYDILTTASSAGDIYGALQTMPGVSSVGEDGGLFVRGGEGRETKTFMDGLLVHKPFSASMPDLPSRGRFLPMMFSGTMFSTGGYSAEYGQAMSSALILTSNGMAEEELTGLYFLPFGGGANKTIKTNNTSLNLSFDYYNLSGYNNLVKQNVHWNHDPVSYNGNYMYRTKLSNGTLIKSFTNASRSGSGLTRPNIDNPYFQDDIKLNNDDVYSNTSFFGSINDNWDFKSGIAYTYDKNLIHFNQYSILYNEHNIQLKSCFIRKINEKLRLNTGVEIWTYSHDFQYNKTSSLVFGKKIINNIPATFLETEIYFSKKITARIGGRYEYSLNNNSSFSPRVSLAAQASSNSQFSIAMGTFHQLPDNDFLTFNTKLNNEKAIHYIANYQYIQDEATFRVEAYYKVYSNLVKYDSLNAPQASSYNNLGNGYARGIDVFYRLNKGLDKNDFWISASWLDTKRNYKDYPQAARPTYFPEYSISAAYKKMITPVNTIVGITFIGSTGRNFHNPNKQGFMNEKTPIYRDISFNASYLTTLMKQQTTIHLSVSNVFGFNNIFGYNFSSVANNGTYHSEPIIPAAKRFILLAVLISI